MAPPACRALEGQWGPTGRHSPSEAALGALLSGAPPRPPGDPGGAGPRPTAGALPGPAGRRSTAAASGGRAGGPRGPAAVARQPPAWQVCPPPVVDTEKK
eukprot:EG_transcript_57936